MPIRRIRRPPRAIPLLQGARTLYQVQLSVAPSRAWRAAFLRPRPALTTARYTPELGRVGLDGDWVHFRTTPPQLHAWLRRIDRWIDYANSVIHE